jgi:hypothetical protein
MLKRWEFWILTVLALATAVLVVANMHQFSANRELQAEVSQRGLYIQQSVPLENLSREIALALAQLSVRTQDEQVRALLGSLGITINVTQTPAAAPAPAPAAAPEPRGTKK